MRTKALLALILTAVIMPFGIHAEEFSFTNNKCNLQQQNAQPEVDSEFIKWVNSIPRNTPTQDLCETVQVNNTQLIGNENYSLLGQGSIFKSDKEPGKLFVLTAAHVVSNSNSITIKCGDKEYRAKLRGISQTHDLAVIELEEFTKKLKPLFTWNGESLPIAEVRHHLEVDDEDYLPKGGHYIQTSADFIPAERLHLVRLTNEGMKTIPNRYATEVKIISDSADHPLIGSKTALLLPNQGIRPGMSGSPILYSVQVRNPQSKSPANDYVEKHFLSGILLKTYINDTQSVAVPVETINEVLPDLLKGKDPARAPSSSYSYEKKIVTTPDGVKEIPTVIFYTDDGEQVIQSVCPSPFSNSSSKGGTGDSTSKGGTGDSTSKGGTGDSSGDAHASYYDSETFSLYRNHYGCKEVGIKDSAGNVYLSILKEDGKIIKSENIEDVSELIHKYGKKFPEYLKKNGIKAADTNKIYQSFCNDKSLFNDDGLAKKVKIARHDFDPKNLDLADYSSSTEIANGNSFMGMKAKVTCDVSKQKIQIQVVKEDIKIDLSIHQGTWKGNINFRGCQSKIFKPSKSPWFIAQKDENLDFQASLSPDENFLAIDIFGANSKCIVKSKNLSFVNFMDKPTPSKEVWLSKINISIPRPPAPYPIEKNHNEKDPTLEKTLKLDNDLIDEALNKVTSNPKRAKEILKQLRNNRLQELEKERLGQKVSDQRLGLLQIGINLLKSKID